MVMVSKYSLVNIVNLICEICWTYVSIQIETGYIYKSRLPPSMTNMNKAYNSRLSYMWIKRWCCGLAWSHQSCRTTPKPTLRIPTFRPSYDNRKNIWKKGNKIRLSKSRITILNDNSIIKIFKKSIFWTVKMEIAKCHITFSTIENCHL